MLVSCAGPGGGGGSGGGGGGDDGDDDGDDTQTFVALELGPDGGELLSLLLPLCFFS